MNSSPDTAISPTLDLFDAPFLASETLKSWGKTLVVAPHPDDESLGVGGLLALLADFKIPTRVAFVSDGAASHLGSTRFPAARLALLRQSEAKLALQKLGHSSPTSAHFLNLPDGALPFPGEKWFGAALQTVCDLLDDFAPQTLILPWRRDPHRDHRATWQLFSHATQNRDLNRVEYLVWAFERAGENEWPRANEARANRLDITGVLPRKLAAIRAHESQLGQLITDAQTAFHLSDEVLAHFERPFEILIQPFQSAPASGTRQTPDFELPAP